MGIMSAICLLTLLLVNSGAATKISSKTLFNVVDVLQGEADKKYNMKDKQMAFLIALSPTECQNGVNVWDYIESFPGDQDDGLGNCCSESHLLIPPNKNTNSPAMIYGAEINRKGTMKDGGCVIFYTTKTPCVSRCFAEQKWDIVSFLMDKAPFTDWLNSATIHMYFVYSKDYFYEKYLKIKYKGSDKQKEYERIQAVTVNGFAKLSAKAEDNSWNIVRCSYTKCDICTINQGFCLNWPVINWNQPVVNQII